MGPTALSSFYKCMQKKTKQCLELPLIESNSNILHMCFKIKKRNKFLQVELAMSVTDDSCKESKCCNKLAGNICMGQKIKLEFH